MPKEIAFTMDGNGTTVLPPTMTTQNHQINCHLLINQDLVIYCLATKSIGALSSKEVINEPIPIRRMSSSITLTCWI
ncbi:MAG: hypothetical protein THHGLFOP_000384 [Candidatus Fervidibacter sp.]